MSVIKRAALSFLVITVTVAACGGNQHEYAPRSGLAARDNYNGASVIADAASPAAFGTAGRPSRGAGAGGAVKAIAAELPIPSRSPRVDSAAMVEGPSEQKMAVAQDVVPGRMLVRVGQASVQVDSLEVGISRVREVARRTGAIIANTSMEDGKEQTRAASLELRIPSEHFDEAVSGLSPIGKLESVNVNVEDVGEEFVDVQARMLNARRLEQRLIDLLANRTGKLTDVLRVESELARVREEIERYEGRLRYLRSRSSVSTLTVALHEAYPIVAEHAGSHPMRDAFAQAGRNFIGVTSGLIASLGVLIPIGALVGAALFIARRFLAKHGLRLPERASGPESA
jgi:acetolactate synthase regulatory subunit